MKAPLRVLLEKPETPIDDFVERELERFETHLCGILSKAATRERLRGAEQFGDWLCGEVREKHQPTRRRRVR